MTITFDQRARLDQLTLEAQDLWSDLRALEAEAYAITGEEDKSGYTSDLVLQSDVDIDRVLELLGIEVEEPKP